MIKRGQIWSIGGQGWRVLGAAPGWDGVTLKSVKNRDIYRQIPVDAFGAGVWDMGDGVKLRVFLVEDR